MHVAVSPGLLPYLGDASHVKLSGSLTPQCSDQHLISPALFYKQGNQRNVHGVA